VQCSTWDYRAMDLWTCELVDLMIWRKVRKPTPKQEIRLSIWDGHFVDHERRGCILENTIMWVDEYVYLENQEKG
jgi:hypothetical protein